MKLIVSILFILIFSISFNLFPQEAKSAEVKETVTPPPAAKPEKFEDKGEMIVTEKSPFVIAYFRFKKEKGPYSITYHIDKKACICFAKFYPDSIAVINCKNLEAYDELKDHVSACK